MVVCVYCQSTNMKVIKREPGISTLYKCGRCGEMFEKKG